MSFFGWGNRAVNSGSTGFIGPTSNPTTSAFLAELDFNGTNASVKAGGENYGVTWIVGVGTTLAIFNLEQVQSTNLDISASTTLRQVVTVQVSSGQSGQFYTKHMIEPGDRLRVRVQSTFTGAANAFISAEPMI